MIDVVLCASGADEVRIVSLMSAELSQQVRVVRRCADLAEALAACEAGVGDAVIVDIDAQGLERTSVHSFAMHGTPAIALVSHSSRREPIQTGITYVIRPDFSAHDLYGVLIEAVASAQETPRSTAWEDHSESDKADAAPMLAVWGPSGGPGRTFIASNLSWELAKAGLETLLVDADTVGPSLSQVLGVIDDIPGLVAACRASLKGTLNADSLTTLTPYVSEQLRIMSGIGVPSRWSEIHVNALEHVLKEARQQTDCVVVDVSSALESLDSYTPGLERNGATLVSLAEASHVLAVVSADPVSLTRFIREGENLREVTTAPVSVILNRVSSTVSVSQMERSLRSRIDIADVMAVPLDPAPVSRAVWDGKLVCETAPRSESARALAAIATAIRTSLLEAE